MKAINYFTVLLLVFCISCKKDNASTGSGNLKLEFISEKNVSTKSTEPDFKDVIAVMDVKSYNANTGEIIFNNKLPDNIGEWKKGEGSQVNVFHNGEILFTLTFSTDIMSSSYNKPVLHYSLLDKSDGNEFTKEKNKWYILSGYPYGTLLGDQTIPENEQLKSFQKEQLKSFQKIKSNWDLFVHELKKSNKYIK